MKPVRSYLPSTVKEVGYISDTENAAMVQEYSLTRYALAPVSVRQSVDFEWIVGNFTQSGFEHILDQQISSDYKIIKFGAGIYLSIEHCRDVHFQPADISTKGINWLCDSTPIMERFRMFPRSF